MRPQVKSFPANLLKFNAYIKVTDDINAAVDVIRKKRLAYSEPCVATYKDKDDSQILHVLFGIGSMDPDNPYFFGIYPTESGYASIDQFMPKLQDIIDEFYGKELTYLRYSPNEPSNLTTEFAGGDITLGEAAIKHVADAIKKDSDGLATSADVYNFVTDLVEALEEEINTGKRAEDEDIERLDASIADNANKIYKLGEEIDNMFTGNIRKDGNAVELFWETYE